MDNNEKYNALREKYPDFIYDSYEVLEHEKGIKITYHFSIPNLVEFTPTIFIPKKRKMDTFTNYLIFHIGMVELISYWKCTCSSNVIIKAGFLSQDQINWFKKLYFYGLGELFYVNKIVNDIDNFMNIKCEAKEEMISKPQYEGEGNLIPVGGGKDSVVTLEILNDDYPYNDCYIINSKPVMMECAKTAGYNENKIINIERTIDKRLIDLNNKGFINGHTPFSAFIAFSAYLIAYLNNKKYIVLSNESSANEGTIIGTKINHQYSKTYEFENDFNMYTSKYFIPDIKYFSLLRPLSELQIGMLFSKYEKYHYIFKSCNVGSKNTNWNWCCKCPKCLFVYIILRPFLTKEKIDVIFDKDLYENQELLPTFIELIGEAETKPFECIGTSFEVKLAVSLVINELLKGNKPLPFLLKYYYDHYPLSDINDNFKTYFDPNNNLDSYFIDLLKKELNKYV